jgi:hypothetical protein
MVTTQELPVFHTYPSYLLRRTVNVMDLHVRLELSGSNPIYNPGSYHTLIGNLPPLSIESLTIDNSGVTDMILGTRQSYSIGPSTSDLRWINSLSPIHTLAHFQTLRKFDAPQEAFFSRSNLGNDFTACQLPAAIEQVTIRHATLAAGRWARYMHTNIHIHPNLKAITLWSNDMPRGHASRPSWHQLKVAGVEIVFRRYGDDSVTIL